jgi:hypothetical protein
MKSKPIKAPDLRGVKIRLPVAPYLIALFKALGVADADQLWGSLQRVTDRAGRRPGEPAHPDRHGQALRSPEVLQHHQKNTLGRWAE